MQGAVKSAFEYAAHHKDPQAVREIGGVLQVHTCALVHVRTARQSGAAGLGGALVACTPGAGLLEAARLLATAERAVRGEPTERQGCWRGGVRGDMGVDAPLDISSLAGVSAAWAALVTAGCAVTTCKVHSTQHIRELQASLYALSYTCNQPQAHLSRC